MNQISEAFRHPNTWHYQDSAFSGAKDSPEDVKEDIADLQDLSTQWRQEEADKKSKEELDRRLQESEIIELEDNLQFLRNGSEIAQSSLDPKQLRETLSLTQKYLRFLTKEKKSNLNVLFYNELKKLEGQLESKLEEVSKIHNENASVQLTQFHDALTKYVTEYRRVPVRTPDNKLVLEWKLLAPVATEIEQLTVSEWQSEAEFEAYFDSKAIELALQNEANRQDLLTKVIEVAVKNAVERGILSKETAEAESKKQWQPDEEFEAWFKDKEHDSQLKAEVQESLMLQSLEATARVLVQKTLTQNAFRGLIPNEMLFSLQQTEKTTVALRSLKTSSEILYGALFSEDFTVFMWEFLTRPDIKKQLDTALDDNNRRYWFSLSTSLRTSYNNNIEEYVKKKREEFVKNIEQKNNDTYAAFLLTFLKVDIDLLTQALKARMKNGGEPFATESFAEKALFQSETIPWWHDIQTMEAAEPFLTPLTQREILIPDDELALPRSPIPEELTRREQRMNFVHALHLKVGLDTPSKFVDYDKANEIVITQHSERCIQMLNQLLLVRGELQSDDYQEQLEHFKKNSELIRHNMPKFAESYMRLNQALGDISGRSIDETSPARQFLTEIYVGGAEKGSRGKHLGALVAFIDFGLADWLKENKAPHETIFEPKENEQERMS